MVSFMVKFSASASDMGSVVKVDNLYCNSKYLNGSVFQLNKIFQ